MGTTIVDSTRNQRVTKHLNGLHDIFKEYPALSFFKLELVKSYCSITHGDINPQLFVKLSGNNFMDVESKLVYKIKSDRFHIKSSTVDFDSYHLYSVEPVRAIINISREES